MKKFNFLALLLFGGAIFAQTLTPTGPLPFDVYDKNNDAKISATEFNAIKQQRMNQKSQDGRLLKNAGNSAAFTDIDKNHDGIINKNELMIHQKNRAYQRTQIKMKNRPMQGKGQGRGMSNQQ